MESSIWAHARGMLYFTGMFIYLQKHGELHMGPCCQKTKQCIDEVDRSEIYRNPNMGPC